MNFSYVKMILTGLIYTENIIIVGAIVEFIYSFYQISYTIFKLKPLMAYINNGQ